jgi:hypothetical protein
MSKNRIDLETALYSLGHTSDDLQTLADMIYDSDMVYSEDRIHTALSGLAELHEARFEKAWQTFKQVYKLDEYRETP